MRRAEKTRSKEQQREEEEGGGGGGGGEGGGVAKAAARIGLTFLQILPPFIGVFPGQVRGQR